MCPFLWATGLDCPGCGTLRAVRALTRGDLLRALDHNVLTVALLPVLLVALVAWWRAETGRRPAVLAVPWLATTLALLVPTWLVLRNLPWLPLLDSAAL